MSNSKLFEPLVVGNAKLRHRMGMCPLTRYRATDEHVPTDLMVEYYSQRSSVPGTLLVTEGTFISPADGGYGNIPGIYTQEQIDGWRKITDAVHANGSFIFCQLWALGRAANPEVAEREGIVISSSDATPGNPNSPVPHKLTVAEIRERVQNYAAAARNAIKAGFDGVELHGANGYLIDQFIQDCCNKRDDEYGGTIEGRSRFAVEAVTAVADAIGPEKTGIRFSPWSTFNNMRMDDPVPQFSDVIRKLNPLGLAFIHLVEARVAGNVDIEADETLDFALDIWDGKLLIAGGLTPESAKQLVDEQYPGRDVVAMFGRSFIATPDLPFRVQHGLELTKYERSGFYTKVAAGYTDYPFSAEFLAQQA